MHRVELVELIRHAEIYKMSLGKSARYREEALEVGALIFQSEVGFYDAVVSGDEKRIEAAAALVKSADYPNANPPRAAWSVWRRSIDTFRALPEWTIVLHWEGDTDHLHWGVVSEEPFEQIREERNEFGQVGYIFRRRLVDGWRRRSVNDIPVSNLHPKARDLSVNMATLNRVQTDADYFRAIMLDEPTFEWEQRDAWRKKAAAVGWHPKPIDQLRKERRKAIVTPQVQEAADHFWDEIERMSDTAVNTAAYANGQTVLRVVKEKEIGFTREQLAEEIGDLLRKQGYKCALTDYHFRRSSTNPHLKMSLDRIDSSRGYVVGNLQIVTRAANFYKSASDQVDWEAKADALLKMAIAMQRKLKAAQEGQAA